VVAEANPRWEKDKHPATRSFQAIRIFINRELDDLDATLEGRGGAGTFHAVERGSLQGYRHAVAAALGGPFKFRVSPQL